MQVRIVMRKNGTSLIEWVVDGNTRRGWIPDSEIVASGGTISVNNPDMSVPYIGVPWSELISLTATPRDLEQELHRRGIWTIEELRANPEMARSALQSVYGIDLAALLVRAAEYEKGM